MPPQEGCDPVSGEEGEKICTLRYPIRKETVLMNSTFWDDYFGMFVDKFGISWMVRFSENLQK